jgi:hypothetical protein
MATFAIDGTSYTYPKTIVYKKEQVATAMSGRPIYSIFWSATLTFPTMTTALWSAMASKFTDGSSHSVTIPHPNTRTDTLYTGCYFEFNNQEVDLGLYTYGAQVTITRIYI